MKNIVPTLKPQPKRKPGNTNPTRIVLADGTVVILPDANGDAPSDLSDTGGVSVAINAGTANLIKYGVAYAPDGGPAQGGAQCAAIVRGGQLASAGDHSVAYNWNGPASVYAGAAYSIQGDASASCQGAAVVTLQGSATIGSTGGGVACAMNLKIQNAELVTDPTAGTVCAGNSSVVVAFTADSDGQNRRPVVGLVGERSGPVEDLLAIETALLTVFGYNVQFGLKANTPYRLDPKTNRFVEVPKAKRKPRK